MTKAGAAGGLRWGSGRRLAAASFVAAAIAGLAAASCRFDRADRWLEVVETPRPPLCVEGALRCREGVERCEVGPSGPRWAVVDACLDRGLSCDPGLKACASCSPGALGCLKGDVARCADDGSRFEATGSCAAEAGLACRQGACVDLCVDAQKTRSNVGCEYWAVDLDNASLGSSLNAAGQQFAVVISNPQVDVPVSVRITQDDGAPGDAPSVSTVAEATISPLSLRVFKLGPREVDGSPDGEFNTGTHTALTRHAYKIESTFPVVAYQFNPLDNASVFSNDASLLKPFSALGAAASGGEPTPAYVVVGWPQTIAVSDDPNTNFDPSGRTQLRAFLTLVGTRPDTKVRVRSNARVLPGGPVAETAPGGVVEVTLGAYDVLNLETDDFNADFTGSLVESNGPVVAFSGSEASDAPFFTSLAGRFCCADHLEDQLDPLRTAGSRYVAAHGPSRTRAVKAAGGQVAPIDEPDYFRVVAGAEGTTTVKTTLPPPDDAFTLAGRGAQRTLAATRNFSLEASAPVVLGNVSPSQEAAGIKRGLPGGDPSFVVVPPVDQFRDEYVFLTPDKYSFDFLTIIARPGDVVTLDGDPIGPERCAVSPGDGLTDEQRGSKTPAFLVYTCQLSFPVVDPSKEAPDNLAPGDQDDGVHRVKASSPVGVLVSGFDSFVSYAYAAGTQLQEINIQ